MVFTRSEHLARHERKHTGEKPFNCIVPGCTRRFSRFDNMMQHTQTHNTTLKNARKKKEQCITVRYAASNLKLIKRTSRHCSVGLRLPASHSVKDDQTLLKREKGKKTDSVIQCRNVHEIKCPETNQAGNDDEESYLTDSSHSSISTLSTTSGSYNNEMMDMDCNKESERIQSNHVKHMMILPLLANYLVNHPDKSPESYFLYHYPEFTPHPQLSVEDLLYPIEKLDKIKPSYYQHYQQGVSITMDEFEALQGLGRFVSDVKNK
ncbi:hypothetical protein BDB01DRAFT_903605 [Pilobolus umbonatus]|nr:hypothetical protein BDB01DRAFT_903605 [Pilobolus umbonatus]